MELNNAALAVVKNTIRTIVQSNPDYKFFVQYRLIFTDESTLGELYASDDLDNRFCYTLEDQVREYGKKVHGETAIPENKDGYDVDVRTSPKYGEVAVIYTRIEMGVYILEHGGIRFDMILAHGGNTDKDTEGCVLVAKNKTSDTTIQGSMKEEVKNKVKEWKKAGFKVKWIIINCK